MEKSGQRWGGHLKDQGLKVVHRIVWVDGLHLLLPPEAHIELPANKKVHVKEIQKEDVDRMEMMGDMFEVLKKSKQPREFSKSNAEAKAANHAECNQLMHVV